ncbi:hypothetical protein [Chryseolinea sp. H1M3-3]|uniref:hypothetical protein n=1 Tax=Chryseolinea sp. H1M3-3 TaxID=3034144 RepID=UPI0023ECD5EB|nr:hypothetical protein [Chryseolinea sp. H1M3-3]
MRRQKISAGRIAQHRNYGDIMARHERDVKLKRITRIFIYFILIAIITIVFFFVRRWEKNYVPKGKEVTAFVNDVKAPLKH